MRSMTRKAVRLAYACAAVTLVAQAAELVKPDIKLGLWEVVNNPQVSGQMPIPEEELAKLPPERRAQIEAGFRASMARAVRPHTYHECMTPEKLSHGFDLDKKGDEASCKRRVISSTSSELTLHDECDRSGEKTVSDIHFQVAGGTQMTGRINVVVTRAGKTMNLNSSLTGKWISSSCGNIKDAETVE